MSFIPDSFHLTCSAIHPPPWHIPQTLHLWSQFHLYSGTQYTSLARMSESRRSSVPGIILCPTKSQFPMIPRGTNWGQWRFFSEYRSLSSGWHYPSPDFTSSITGCPALGLWSLVGNHLSQKNSTWSHANSQRGCQGLDFPICIKETCSGTQSKPATTPKMLSILQGEKVPRSD